MSTEAAARGFFTATHFAVVGASTNPSKFGYKVLAWYKDHAFPVTPINPTSARILDIPTLANLSALPSPTTTNVSIITPPPVTVKVLEEAKKLGIKGVWLQPGTFDEAILAGAKKDFEFVVGGEDEGTVGGEGWCVLVDGVNAARAAGVKL